MLTNARWKVPVDAGLAAGDVHVWRVALNRLAPEAGMRTFLSKAEEIRAERFVFGTDRRRYIVAHAALRDILARYLTVGPEDVLFQEGTRGKPEVVNGGGITFNLSHSGELALVAVTRGRRIGVDIEARRLLTDAPQIAAKTFSACECHELLSLPPSQRLEGFFNAWTRKEAFVKATGDGIAGDLTRFDVSLAPGAPAELRAIDGVPDEAARWSMHAVPVGSEYVAALAVEGRPLRIQCFTWAWPVAAADLATVRCI